MSLILNDTEGLDEMSTMMPSKYLLIVYFNIRSKSNDGTVTRNGPEELCSTIQEWERELWNSWL